MKINQSLEQATYVLVILGLQADGAPVKSRVLSAALQVSDSYLKKVLQQLKRGGLITANASKHGGYQLARPLADITLKDVFFALGLADQPYELNHLAQNIFPDQAHWQASEKRVTGVLDRALASFYDQLATLSLAELVKEGVGIDWDQRLKELTD